MPRGNPLAYLQAPFSLAEMAGPTAPVTGAGLLSQFLDSEGGPDMLGSLGAVNPYLDALTKLGTLGQQGVQLNPFDFFSQLMGKSGASEQAPEQPKGGLGRKPWVVQNPNGSTRVIWAAPGQQPRGAAPWNPPKK